REIYRSAFSWIPAAPGTVLRRLAFKPLFGRSSSFRIGPGVFILGFKNISLGQGVALNRHSSLTSDRGRITLGNHVYLGDFSIISGDDGEVSIGNNVLIGPNCLIQAANHRFDRLDVPIMEQGHTPGKIVIEDDVWIGGNVVICPGAHIGSGCVIGAGAVVTGRIPPRAVAAGVPARVIKFRGEE
ncbi:MAG: acyltransferase, partial [Desulfovibrionaceae bacterium]|nr:acyltransferase [Desulfovibrionaceae bacterium]